MSKKKKIVFIICGSAFVITAITFAFLFWKHKTEKEFELASLVVADSIIMADRAQQMTGVVTDTLAVIEKVEENGFPRAMLSNEFNARYSVVSNCSSHEEGKNKSLGKITIDCSSCDSVKKIHFDVVNQTVQLLNKENPDEWFFQLQMDLATLKVNTVNPPFDIKAALTAAVRDSKTYAYLSNVDGIQPIVFDGGVIQMEKIARYGRETTLSFTVYLSN